MSGPIAIDDDKSEAAAKNSVEVSRVKEGGTIWGRKPAELRQVASGSATQYLSC